MRGSAILLLLVAFIRPLGAQIPVTVAQLEQFLTSRDVAKESDAVIADQLSNAMLKEQLTEPTLSRILKEARPGPKTVEQLQLLALSSIFKTPPSAELPTAEAPDPVLQKQMITATQNYVK